MNEAIFNPNSTTGLFVSVNIIAPPIRTMPQTSVKKRDHAISVHAVASRPVTPLNRSRYVDDASELMEEDKVPIAEASTPATTRPAMPVGRFSMMNFGNTSSEVARPSCENVAPP